MNSKESIKLYSLCLILIFSINIVNANKVSSIDDYKKYCIESSGVILNNIVNLSTRTGYVEGYSVDFCEIVYENNLGMIGLETLASDKPSIAATYTKILAIDTSRVIRGNNVQPATNLCTALGGSTINQHFDGGFYDERGYSGVCFFGDGSHIATWTLYYVGIGGRNDIKEKIRADPLSITIPNIYEN
jgi:hypothetical protein